MQVVYPTALAVAFAALLTVVAGGPRGSWLVGGLPGRFLTTFGTFSYALYLFHNPVQAAFATRSSGPRGSRRCSARRCPASSLFYVAATLPALALAWLSWHLYEKPWLRLKRFFPSTARPVPVPRANRGATKTRSPRRRVGESGVPTSCMSAD